jgi:GT2 family glycosyltransferase
VDAPKVCIVTPVRDDWAATSRYLASIEDLIYPDVEVIIVDDGSTDGSAHRIKEQFPRVIVLSGDGNLWWAGATNKGATEALERGARFIFTCNNDVLLDREVISSSVDCALEAGNALVGAVVFFQQDAARVWFAGARFDRSTGDILLDTEMWPESEGPKPSQMLTGMGMLIPADLFRDVGGFDSDAFPHYLADSDFSLRAAARGYQLLVSPGSRIYNDVSSAWSVREFERGRLGFLLEMLLSMRSAYWVKARVRFYRRHWGPGWLRALVRLYRGWFGVYAWPIIRRKVSPIFRRRRTG